MPKPKREVHRFTGYFDPELFKSVQEMADEEKRPFNTQLELLVEYAIKEKTRKRKKQ